MQNFYTFYRKTQSKTKRKQGNVLSSLLRAAVLGFFIAFIDDLVSNRLTLAATALYESYNITIVKKIQLICFFFRDKYNWEGINQP